jgi:rhodanese-related sulfurtransferase
VTRPEENGGRTFRGRPVDHVIDVRSKLEFWLGHLDGAVCVPVGVVGTELPARREISRDSRILVYCGSGVRSAQAMAELRALGYRNVVDGGGMAAAAAEFRS